MKTKYSKPLGDISLESEEWIANEDRILAQQSEHLASCEPSGIRTECLLCGLSLNDAPRFSHRSISYLSCPQCTHIQAEEILSDAASCFDGVYPALEIDLWQSRCNRIYTPKLQWILNELDSSWMPSGKCLREHWFEIGTGAGYFLGALKAAGAVHCRGIDADPHLVARANSFLGKDTVACTGNFGHAIEGSQANIFVSFFVLEHLSDPLPLIKSLRSKPAGTIFAFSVPTYGLSAILESAFGCHAARNLDNILHRQLYTDASIERLLRSIDYEPLAQWVFGQDALDFKRAILKPLLSTYDRKMFSYVEARLNDIMELLQGAVDISHLADARHVLAVKR
ncbi:MAG: class I SAM-dependent methyltransferase [Proteobacteria bacterium]|nr:class I SAM-dependent methyltransferase [Pseudomonadota bacterium]